MDVSLTAFSLPMFSTFVYVHPFRLLIDAGDGATAMLGQKIHSVDTVALTHAHRDHCAGLLQLVNLRAGNGDLHVVYPSASRSIQALKEFSGRFDAVAAGRVIWTPVERRAELDLTIRNVVLRNFPVKHIPETDTARARTLGYHVIETKHKLRPEYAGLPQAELDKVRARLGRDAIVAPVEEKILSASGDTLPIDPAEYAGAKILLHECTFLSDEDRDMGGEEGRDHWHSTLPEVMRLAREVRPERLVLYHISQRYPAGQIAESALRAAAKFGVGCPLHAVWPGRLNRDVLAEEVGEFGRRRGPRRNEPDGDPDRPAEG